MNTIKSSKQTWVSKSLTSSKRKLFASSFITSIYGFWKEDKRLENYLQDLEVANTAQGLKYVFPLIWKLLTREKRVSKDKDSKFKEYVDWA